MNINNKNRDQMSANLSEQIEKIRALMKEQTTTGATKMYAIAVEVNAVMGDKKKYGKGAVKQIAKAVGQKVATLYSYGAVAKTWNATAFEALLKSVSSMGQPLTFSHFVELAKVKDMDEDGRRALIKEALDKSLSVRDFARLLRQQQKKGNRAAPTSGRIAAATAAAAKDAEKKLEKLVHAVEAAPPTPEDAQASVANIEKTLEIYKRALALFQGRDEAHDTTEMAAE